MSGTEVCYEITGPADAPVIMFAGALGSTLRMWDPQVDALAGRFRVLRYDHRGHGGSPAPPGPYRMADLGGDALALLDRLGIERVAFCGLSLGGMVGIWLGEHAPDRLDSLVLCCTTARFPDPAPWYERAATVREKGTESVAPTIVSRWYTPGWAAEHPDVVDRTLGMITGADDEGYAGCAEAIAEWDGRDLLGTIGTPTLVIGAAQDASTPVTPHLEALAAAIPGAGLHVLDAAHLVTVELAAQANALISAHVAAG